VIDGRRHVVPVGAAADEERHRAGRDVLGRQAAKGALDLDLAATTRPVRQLAPQHVARHVREQGGYAGDAAAGQHLGASLVGERQVAHDYWIVSRKALYCSPLISVSISAASATFSLRNQPVPSASSLTAAGVPSRSLLTATTSPATGA